MIEILPNWHPLFVHFTVALFSMSVVFFVVQLPFAKTEIGDNFMVIARYSLWLGVLFSIATIIAGWDAYNTVNHDTPSHSAMTDHRNWGLVTFAVFVFSAIWWKIVKNTSEKASLAFLLCLFVGAGLLVNTGHKGSQLVYKFGLGVKSLPAKDDHKAGGGHDHAHGDTSGTDHHMNDTDTSKDHSHDTMPEPDDMNMDNHKMEPDASNLNKAESATKMVSKPKIDNTPKEIDKPKVEKTLKIVSKLKTENLPTAIDNPKIENAPEVVSKSEVESEPKTVSRPKVESTPKVVSKPEVENVSKVMSKPKDMSPPEVAEKSEAAFASEPEATSEIVTDEENTFLIPNDNNNTFLIPGAE